MGLRQKKLVYFRPTIFQKTGLLSRFFTRYSEKSPAFIWNPKFSPLGTHARKLPNAVAFGPGIPDQSYYRDEEGLFPDGHGSCHMPDEAQSIPALKEALRIYIRGVIALDGQDLSKEE